MTRERKEWWQHKASLLIYAVEVEDGLAVRAAGPYLPDFVNFADLDGIPDDDESWTEEDAQYLNENPRVRLDDNGWPRDWTE